MSDNNHSTKTAKIFWVTLDVAMHMAAYGRPKRSPLVSFYIYNDKSNEGNSQIAEFKQ